jgi:predicted lactoylglutathione lyase/ABC-type transporter Mla MlaB component
MVSHPRTISFAIEGPIARGDLPGLCERVCTLLKTSDAEVAICEVSGVDVDAVTVEALARLQLAARRHGCRVRLCGASTELLALVAFMGLTDVLPCHDRTPQPQGGASMASNGHRKIFVNLAVQDLDRSVAFFEQLGFEFDPRFTDETATCMIVSEEAFVMLLLRDRFKDFTKKDLADPTAQTEAIVAFSADSREQVDELAEKALAAGGSPANDPIDMDFMYSRSFQDPDGHLWELVWMDMGAVPAQ